GRPERRARASSGRLDARLRGRDRPMEPRPALVLPDPELPDPRTRPARGPPRRDGRLPPRGKRPPLRVEEGVHADHPAPRPRDGRSPRRGAGRRRISRGAPTEVLPRDGGQGSLGELFFYEGYDPSPSLGREGSKADGTGLRPRGTLP